jgi:signal transduction histidine kinase/ActR/RegA family two-component response regulator
MILPEAIGRYLCEWIAERHPLAYLLLDLDGRIESWDGRLDRLGIGPLERGRDVAHQLFFMAGILPLPEERLYLPMVNYDGRHTLDVHILRMDAGYALILMDTQRQAREMAALQQRFNRRALARRAEFTTATAPLDDLFFACDMAAFQMVADGRFALIGKAPAWLTWFCPDTSSGKCDFNSGNVFSFLDNFLFEAQQFWATDQVGSRKSGAWIERDDTGREYLFEATAVNTGSARILLIADERGHIAEKRNLIQRGRELALDRSSLEKTRQALQRAHDALEKRIRKRSCELEQTNHRLAEELYQRHRLEVERTEILMQLQQVQKMEAIGTLAGGIAHDFNNILSAVIGFTELSLMEVPADSKLNANLQQVFAAAQRAKELIRQILTFSRQTHPENLPVQVALIIREALKMLRASLPASIEIETALHSESYVLADPTQLHQVVLNLCTNSTHAMQEEGGVLRIALRDRPMEGDAVLGHPDLIPGRYLELTVADTGHGMTEETMARIYDPFFTTKDKGQGTGMGLSMIHGIVKECKGDISVTSQPGKGTTFKVLLPVCSPSQTVDMAKATAMPGGSEDILFVDDEPMQTDLATKILVPLGYHVKAFNDSVAALDAFRSSPDGFDLIVTDMYMPKMNGKKLASKIHDLRPRTPIILCTGYADTRVADPVENGPIDDYLMKPFSMRDLALTIRKVLDRSSESDA